MIVTLANSCLRPVASLDGAHVTTVEGVGSKSTGYHPIQVAMAENDGTQCGYCTPGMVMSIYGLLSKNASPSKEDVEQFCQGNICRCTGYASIYKSARAAVASSTSSCVPKSSSLESVNRKLHARILQSTVISSDSSMYINATTLSQVFDVLDKYGPPESSSKLRLLVGNTSKGVVKYYDPKNSDQPTVFCDISRIPELLSVSINTSDITFGASVTISTVIKTMEKLVSKGGAFTKKGSGPYVSKEKQANTSIFCFCFVFSLRFSSPDPRST